MLPIKGAHVTKSDNPVILCGSNHALRSLFKKKHNYSCSCKDLPFDTLCASPETTLDFGCTFPAHVKHAYSALATRFVEIELTDPIFPSDKILHEGRPLWSQWFSFLKENTTSFPSHADSLKSNDPSSAPGQPPADDAGPSFD